MNEGARLTRLIVVSGLSGAGKSIALHTLEDLGYYCTDNLPAPLLPAFAAQLEGDGSLYDCAAVGIDARNPAGTLDEFPEIFAALERKGTRCELLFLEADDGTLIKRFSETRRKHPLTAGERSLSEAIGHERELLAPLMRQADFRIDTSRTNLHQLRDRIRERVHRHRPDSLSLLFLSFGFKQGAPLDADFVFDARCLPNPHWSTELRPLTGRDEKVIRYLEEAPLVNEMFDDLRAFLETWVPRFEAENRAYLTIAVGCTGGQHRSVYLAERLARHFRALRGEQVMVRHRELE